jgi:hypothetical protein
VVVIGEIMDALVPDFAIWVSKTFGRLRRERKSFGDGTSAADEIRKRQARRVRPANEFDE